MGGKAKGKPKKTAPCNRKYLQEATPTSSANQSMAEQTEHQATGIKEPTLANEIQGPLLNGKRGLSVRNGVLLYMPLIRPLMDYVCPAWR